jgi:hypothetical protein
MRRSILSALVVLALSVSRLGAQAVLAPPTEVPPGSVEGPVRLGGSAVTPPSGQEPVRQLPVEPQAAPQSFDAPPEGGPLAREWQQFEYLLWWIRDARVPPLITANRTGPVPVLSEPSTTVVVGNRGLDNLDHSGGRFTLGGALDSAGTLGLEGTYFFLGSRTTTVGAGTSGAPGTPSLGIPFNDVTTGTQSVQTVTYPGFARGSVSVSDSARLQGAELNGLVNLAWNGWFQADGLIGFRYFEVDEGIQLAYLSNQIALPGVMGLQTGAADQFDGHNRFYGGQLGLRLNFIKGPVFLNLVGKVALGDTYEVVRINGVNATGLPGQPAHLTQGGTLAVMSNSGRFARDQFAVLPEATVRVGVLLPNKTRLFVGYNLIYLSALARPGNQIDTAANPTQIPRSTRGNLPFFGPARPQFAFQGTDFWAQGLVLGVEYRY